MKYTAPAGRTAITDALYPVGYVVTLPAVTFGNAVAGETMPEVGTLSGATLSFDDATTETANFFYSSEIPQTWQTVSFWLEVLNLSDAGDVRWSVSHVGTAPDVTTTVVPVGRTAVRVGLESYTLDRLTVGGWDRPGGTLTVSRVGGDAADTFVGDLNLMAFCVRRESSGLCDLLHRHVHG